MSAGLPLTRSRSRWTGSGASRRRLHQALARRGGGPVPVGDGCADVQPSVFASLRAAEIWRWSTMCSIRATHATFPTSYPPTSFPPMRWCPAMESMFGIRLNCWH